MKCHRSFGEVFSSQNSLQTPMLIIIISFISFLIRTTAMTMSMMTIQPSSSSSEITVLSGRSPSDIAQELGKYSPLLIEGPGQADTRDATVVGKHIVERLKGHWNTSTNTSTISKPVLVITQGDPMKKGPQHSGIASICRVVAEELGAPRLLVYLDESIDPTHGPGADRHNVIYELKYSDMERILTNHHHDCNGNKDERKNLSHRIDEGVEKGVSERNDKKRAMGQPELGSYIQDFALLQEKTKCALKAISSEITIAHTVTMDEISEFSVTSFYNVGLDLGIIDKEGDMLFYQEQGAGGTGSSDVDGNGDGNGDINMAGESPST